MQLCLDGGRPLPWTIQLRAEEPNRVGPWWLTLQMPSQISTSNQARLEVGIIKGGGKGKEKENNQRKHLRFLRPSTTYTLYTLHAKIIPSALTPSTITITTRGGAYGDPHVTDEGHKCYIAAKLAKLGNWAFLKPVPESQSYSTVLKPSVPTDYTLLFWSCLVLWEAALYGLHQNLSFQLVSSWVLSMQGGKRIKLGYLVPCLPCGVLERLHPPTEVVLSK